MDFDLPFGDPSRTHGSGMEGWYWRFVLPGGRVIVTLTGVCQTASGPWALVALAAHPGAVVRQTLVEGAQGRRDGFGVRCGEVLGADAAGVSLQIGDDELHAELLDPVLWPRRAWGALGPAQMVPRLPQHWHPHVLRAATRGHATIGGERIDLAGGFAYAEKNWGPAFAGDWWWGQGFLDAGTTVAFAGGRLAVGAPTAVVLSRGDELLRLSPPLARVTTSVADGAWRIRAASPRHRVDIEGDATGEPHVLPVPVRLERRVQMRSRQHLTGRMRVVARRGARTLLDEETGLAGLELGLSDPRPGAPQA